MCLALGRNNIMVQTTQSAIEHLTSLGFKSTVSRKKILSVLFDISAPITVQEILDTLALQDVSIHKTTVYREIDLLLRLGIIQELSVKPLVKHYEIACLQHHHHHICDKCGKIEEIDTKPIERSIQEVAQKASQSGLAIMSHNLEFHGLCAGCK